jgi:hypothetical protein
MNPRHTHLAYALRDAMRLVRIPTQPHHENGQLAVRTAAGFIASALVAEFVRFERAEFLKLAGCD